MLRGIEQNLVLVSFSHRGDYLRIFDDEVKSILATMLNRLENYSFQNKKLTPIAMHIL